jgi:hypothetical protein
LSTTAPPNLSLELERRVSQMNESVRTILGMPKDDRATAVVERMKEVAALTSSVHDTLVRAQSSNWKSAEVEQLKAFDAEVRIWRVVIPSTLTDDFHANARARYADAGAWAVHFSIVRMTVSTFFVTAAWGVVSLKWEEYSFPLAMAAGVTWLLAGFFLFVFTRATYLRSRRQQKLQELLPTPKSDNSRSRDIDGPTKAWRGFVGWFGVKQRGDLPELSPQNRRNIWMPFWVYLVVSVLYFCLLCAWGCHESSKKPMDQLALAVASIEVTLHNIADCLPCADDDGDVEHCTHDFSEPSGQTPTPTLTPTPTPTTGATGTSTSGPGPGCPCPNGDPKCFHSKLPKIRKPH